MQPPPEHVCDSDQREAKDQVFLCSVVRSWSCLYMQEINNSKVVAATTSQISPTSSSPEQQQTQLMLDFPPTEGRRTGWAVAAPLTTSVQQTPDVLWLSTGSIPQPRSACHPQRKPGQAAQMPAGLLRWLSHQGRVLRCSTPWDDLLPCGNSSGTLAIFQREHF